MATIDPSEVVICTLGEKSGKALGVLMLLLAASKRAIISTILPDGVFGNFAADAMRQAMSEAGVDFDGATVTLQHVLALFERLNGPEFGPFTVQDAVIVMGRFAALMEHLTTLEAAEDIKLGAATSPSDPA